MASIPAGFPGPEFTCSTCAFYDRKENECRRALPVPERDAGGLLCGEWPKTAEDAWCASHRLPKPKVEPNAEEKKPRRWVAEKRGRPGRDWAPLLEHLRQYANTIPTALNFNRLHRLACGSGMAPANSTFHGLVMQWEESGVIVAIEKDGEATRYYAPGISTAAPSGTPEITVED